MSSLFNAAKDTAAGSGSFDAGDAMSRFFSGAGKSLAGKNPILKMANGDIDWWGTSGGIGTELAKAAASRTRVGKKVAPIIEKTAKGVWG
jgi:hypothetical protein